MSTSLTRTVLAAVATALAIAAGPTVPDVPSALDASWHGVVRGDLGIAPDGDPLAVGQQVLAAHAAVLGVDADRFVLDHVTTSHVGTHVRGREQRGGVPVHGTSAAVHLVDGKVVQVEARPSELPGRPADVAIPARSAARAALRQLGLTSAEHVAAQRLLAPHAERLVDVWRVDVVSLSGVAGTIDVAAADGRIVAAVDDRRFADGVAQVFDPNPIVALQDNSLRQPGVDVAGVDTDLPSADLDAARVTLPILEVDVAALAAGRLVGPWVDVRGPAPLAAGIEASPTFDFGRHDPRFEAVMAYAHLDRAQRWFQDDLGLQGVNDESQLVIAMPVAGFDNSFYQPGNDLMLLGAGGVDDGEDAEVILHEYGHAVHDAQVPGWGSTHEGGAMGEGFGDFLAAAYYAREVSQGFQDECVADWDATSYSTDDPPCLRRTDGTRRWPDDRTGSVHADGEIWSSFLWRLRDRMVAPREAAGMDATQLATRRSDRVMRLLLTSHTFLTPTATFADAVAALETAADALGEQELVPHIRQEAEASGFEVF